MRTGGHEQALHRIYRSLLWRSPGPVDLERFPGRFPFPYRRATFRLRQDREHREFIAPLLVSTTGYIATLCSREPREAELQAVINGIRSLYANLDQQVRAVARIRSSASLSAANISEARRAIGRLFRELLARPVDDDSVALYCVRVLMGLASEDQVRREIQDSEEYLEVVLPLKGRIERIFTTYLLRPPTSGETRPVSTTGSFATLCGREPREAELQAVIDEIRSNNATLDQQVHAVTRIQSSASPSAASISEVRRAVGRLFRELLARPVDDDSVALYCVRLLMGLVSEDQVRREIQDSEEYLEVVLPLKGEIERISTTYLLRPPTSGEIQDAIDRFRTRFVTLEQQRAAIAAGEARLHLGIRPLKLELDITSQCNLRCVMCYFSTERFSKRKRIDLTVEQFARIADQLLPYCSQMSFSIGTEPLLNQGFAEMLDIARSYQVPWIYMNTNAQLLDASLIERIVDDGLHGLAISIDAATKSTYERIRFGGKYDRLMSNLRALNEEKRRRKSEFPVVTFNFVLMRSNVQELPALIELASVLNVEGIVAMHLMPFEGLDIGHESLAREPHLWNRVLAEARELGERLEVPLALPDPFELERAEGESLKPSTPVGFQLNVALAPAESQCKFPWVFVGIDPYGTVNPCGYWFEEQPMGNILNEDFEAIWHKQAYTDLRREHIAGQLRGTCQNCPAAGMGGVDHDDSFREIRLGDSPEPGANAAPES